MNQATFGALMAVTLVAAPGCQATPAQPSAPARTCKADGFRTAGPCSEADFDAQQKEQALFGTSRKDLEAVLAEEERLIHAGATELTPAITDRVAEGEYLATLREEVKKFKDNGRTVSGHLQLASATMLLIDEKQLVMEVCEDYRGFSYKEGNDEYHGNLTLGDAVFTKIDDKWKLASKKTHKVDECPDRS